MDATAGIELGTVLVRSKELVFSPVEGEISLLNVGTGKYYGLVSVGARIWTLLADPMKVQTICDHLMSQYRVDRATCEAGVLSFVRQMAAEGVVTTAPALIAERDCPPAETGQLAWEAPGLLVEEVKMATQGGTTGDVNPVDDSWYS
jgi:hypothetical protein